MHMCAMEYLSTIVRLNIRTDPTEWYFLLEILTTLFGANNKLYKT
jgi:hypothetical protein